MPAWSLTWNAATAFLPGYGVRIVCTGGTEPQGRLWVVASRDRPDTMDWYELHPSSRRLFRGRGQALLSTQVEACWQRLAGTRLALWTPPEDITDGTTHHLEIRIGPNRFSLGWTAGPAPADPGQAALMTWLKGLAG